PERLTGVDREAHVAHRVHLTHLAAEQAGPHRVVLHEIAHIEQCHDLASDSSVALALRSATDVAARSSAKWQADSCNGWIVRSSGRVDAHGSGRRANWQRGWNAQPDGTLTNEGGCPGMR